MLPTPPPISGESAYAGHMMSSAATCTTRLEKSVGKQGMSLITPTGSHPEKSKRDQALRCKAKVNTLRKRNALIW